MNVALAFSDVGFRAPQGVTRTQAVVVGALMIGVLLVRALYEFAMLTFTSIFSHVPGFADYWLNVADQVALLYSYSTRI